MPSPPRPILNPLHPLYDSAIMSFNNLSNGGQDWCNSYPSPPESVPRSLASHDYEPQVSMNFHPSEVPSHGNPTHNADTFDSNNSSIANSHRFNFPSTELQSPWSYNPRSQGLAIHIDTSSFMSNHNAPSQYPSASQHAGHALCLPTLSTYDAVIPPSPGSTMMHSFSHLNSPFDSSSPTTSEAMYANMHFLPRVSIQQPTNTPPLTPSNQSAQLESDDELHSPEEGFAQHGNFNRQLFTHKEQLHLFRDALKLPGPSGPVWGPFIPQQMYRPHTNSDRRRYVEEVDLEAPIYFWTESPRDSCGISLADALHSRVRHLLDKDETVFQGRGPSVSIRLEWPGYRQWSRQIPTKDFRSPPGPITRAKLAKNVAKCVQRFISERHDHPLEDDADETWRVGPLKRRIQLDDLILVSIHHVSMGSWQPQLRLRAPLNSLGRLS